MSATAAQAQVESTEQTAARPYPPSWVDRLTDQVRRLNAPAWLVYLGSAIVAVLVHSALKWSEGLYPVGEFFPLHVLTAFAPFVAIALLHYTDNWATEALTDFRPALLVGDADYEKFRYQLTTLPNRPTWIASAIGALYGASSVAWLSPEEMAVYKTFGSPQSFATDTLWSTVNYAMTAILIYHSVRQLRMVSRIYTTHTRIDLFQLEPLYAFSSLSARTAIGLGAISYAWASIFIGLGGSQAGWAGLVETGAFTFVILTVFIWPLLGIHRLLQKEKKRLKAANALQIKGVIAELHRRREASEYANMAGINEAMESLLKEQTVVDKIPTWPWQPETLRGVGTAILLPVFVWLITRVLERFVAF